MDTDAKSRPVYENLDTTFVNLAALLRYLQQREFVGYVHVELDEYDADVFLDAQSAPHVRETDHRTGREGVGEAALQRLLVRAREAGGLVSVYEWAAENVMTGEPAATAVKESGGQSEETGAVGLSEEELEWRDLLSVSSELIAAVERAAARPGADFAAAFRSARLELADDYPFLDPSAGRFEYANGEARVHPRPSIKTYATGVSECLRRVVDRLARGSGGRHVRERVVPELAVLARRRQTALAQFELAPQLDRIAGTRVL